MLALGRRKSESLRERAAFQFPGEHRPLACAFRQLAENILSGTAGGQDRLAACAPRNTNGLCGRDSSIDCGAEPLRAQRFGYVFEEPGLRASLQVGR
jgi:hypothetical protein